MRGRDVTGATESRHHLPTAGALSLVQRERDPFFSALIGQHGAMTPDEVLVPLLTTT